MKSEKCSRLLALSIAAMLCVVSCASPEAPQTNTPQTGTTPDTPVTPPVTPPVTLPAASKVAGEAVAYESVLRAIPTKWIDAARTGLHIAYFHTSHGTHVSYGLYGLQSYKTGDDTLYAISTAGESGKLDFQDHNASASPQDLSQADDNWANWISQVETYLDNTDNSEINVMMWSWCSIRGHKISDGYLPSMQTLINEYGEGGSKIGTGTGKTHATPVTFIFMTGHAWGQSESETPDTNNGTGAPADQAALINAYCQKNGYYCLDYYSIETHDMAGTYWSDASDDSYSPSGGKFNEVWQKAHTEGVDWFYNLSAPGGSVEYGSHLTQYITANRKAYAMWYILARVAGWDGN
jgi:hypothetical protein